MSLRRLGLILATAAFFFACCATSPEAIACPTCKEAVASQPGDDTRLQDGYSCSILFMIAVPFTLLGVGTAMLVKAAHRGTLPQL